MSSLDIGLLMQQAATLRSHSQKPFRRFFDSSAPWIQQTMYASPEIDRLRNSEDSEAILTYAYERKERGNSLFKDGCFQEAQNEYFNSISVLRWMQNTCENWQRKDIDDSTIVRREFVSSDKVRQAEARNLEIAVLLNLARCYQKSSEWTNSIRACDDALVLNPTCTKALYLRAKARYIPLCSDISDWELALGDFKEAVNIEPDNQQFKESYMKLKSDIQRQHLNEKATFGGMFNRSTTIDPPTFSARSKESSSDVDYTGSISFEQAKEYLRDAECAAIRLEQTGNVADAFLIREKVKALKESHGRLSSDDKEENNGTVNFLHPSDEMIRQAAIMGLNLNDERVCRLLHEMSMDSSGNTIDIANRAAEKIQREYANETADKLLSDVSTVEMKKMLRSRLGRELTVDEVCDCPEVLRDYLATDLIEVKRAKGSRLSSNVSNISDDELSDNLLKQYSCCVHKRDSHSKIKSFSWLQFSIVILIIVLYAFVFISPKFVEFRRKYLYAKKLKHNEILPHQPGYIEQQLPTEYARMPKTPSMMADLSTPSVTTVTSTPFMQHQKLSDTSNNERARSPHDAEL